MKSEARGLNFKHFVIDEKDAVSRSFFSRLAQKIAGHAHEHITFDGKRIICRSVVNYMGNGIWRLESIGAGEKSRSGGFASAHLKNVLKWLKRRRKQPAKALIFEIEDCSPGSVVYQVAEERNRREFLIGRFDLNRKV